MNTEDSKKQLGVNEDDVRLVRDSKDTNSILLVLLGTLTSIAAFVAGYVVTKEGDDTYPFSSMGALTLASARKARVPWLGILIIAVVAFLSLGVGGLVADPPNFGAGTYYGVYCKKA